MTALETAQATRTAKYASLLTFIATPETNISPNLTVRMDALENSFLEDVIARLS